MPGHDPELVIHSFSLAQAVPWPSDRLSLAQFSLTKILMIIVNSTIIGLTVENSNFPRFCKDQLEIVTGL